MTNTKPKYWENQETVKVAVVVHKHQYDQLKSRLHHGQMTQLIRGVVASVNQKIKEKKTKEVIDFIYKDHSITLTPVIDPDINPS